jgi:hypothetical protein
MSASKLTYRVGMLSLTLTLSEVVPVRELLIGNGLGFMPGIHNEGHGQHGSARDLQRQASPRA